MYYLKKTSIFKLKHSLGRRGRALEKGYCTVALFHAVELRKRKVKGARSTLLSGHTRPCPQINNKGATFNPTPFQRLPTCKEWNGWGWVGWCDIRVCIRIYIRNRYSVMVVQRHILSSLPTVNCPFVRVQMTCVPHTLIKSWLYVAHMLIIRHMLAICWSNIDQILIKYWSNMVIFWSFRGSHSTLCPTQVGSNATSAPKSNTSSWNWPQRSNIHGKNTIQKTPCNKSCKDPSKTDVFPFEDIGSFSKEQLPWKNYLPLFSVLSLQEMTRLSYVLRMQNSIENARRQLLKYLIHTHVPFKTNAFSESGQHSHETNTVLWKKFECGTFTQWI